MLSKNGKPYTEENYEQHKAFFSLTLKLLHVLKVKSNLFKLIKVNHFCYHCLKIAFIVITVSVVVWLLLEVVIADVFAWEAVVVESVNNGKHYTKENYAFI